MNKYVAGAVVIPLILCVSACAQHVWVKQGANQTDYSTDSYGCEKDARQSGYFGGGIAGSINMQEFFNKCMVAHGWSVQGTEANQANQAATVQQNSALTEWKNQGEIVKLECKTAVKAPALEILRDKVELTKSATDAPPPFSILSNENYPTDQEKVAISRWGTIRSDCNKIVFDHFRSAPTSGPKDKNAMQELTALNVTSIGKVDSLAADLYQGKLTYGEFAKRRMEVAAEYQTAYRDWQKSNNVKLGQ